MGSHIHFVNANQKSQLFFNVICTVHILTFHILNPTKNALMHLFIAFCWFKTWDKILQVCRLRCDFYCTFLVSNIGCWVSPPFYQQ